MFNIIFLIKSEYNNIFEEIYKKILISNMHYDKIILYLEDNQTLNIEKNEKIEIFEENKEKYNNFNKLYNKNENKIPFIISEISNKYHGLCTFINLSKINDNQINNIINLIINNIQQTLIHGIYIKNNISYTNMGENSNEKLYYNQYESIIKDKPYYEISIISFNFEHIWIKKLIFELNYLYPLIENSNFFINFLYYKYIMNYAKPLL